MFQRRMLMCGIYLRDRRFWVCKIIILVMDMAILRGAISMGEEYCSQDDEISEFGWILWSSFLVFCKFVYLRPVHHLHQLGVFHGTRCDAAKARSLKSCHLTRLCLYMANVLSKCTRALTFENVCQETALVQFSFKFSDLY